jgi:Anti-sigma-K factor rskA
MTPPLDPEFGPESGPESGPDPELVALLADPSMWEEPSAALAEKVRVAVRTEVDKARAHQPEPQLAPVVPIGKPNSAPEQKGPTRLRRLNIRWMAVAAAAILALGAFGISRRSSTSRPEGILLALAATELLPGAAGSVEITQTESGLKIELDAIGLPRRDGQRFYQAWLKGEAGLVPIGTFHSGENVTLWAGVALKDFPAITITEEEVGDQDSSGRRVLVGTSVSP